jgi:4-oxalocrotonate tautomerase
MPHVIVKFYPGRSDADKQAMAAGVAQVLAETMGYDVGNVSIAIEEVEQSEWMDRVYTPDISGRERHLVKRPEYGPLARR